MRQTPQPVFMPTAKKGGGKIGKDTPTSAAQQNFLVIGANMGWQLVVVVLLPIIAGAKLDKALNTAPTCTIIGLVLAVIGSGLVMWRTTKLANKLPVPKVSASEKRAIQKSYDEDDN